MSVKLCAVNTCNALTVKCNLALLIRILLKRVLKIKNYVRNSYYLLVMDEDSFLPIKKSILLNKNIRREKKLHYNLFHRTSITKNFFETF
jgi:hypothetical protein